MVLDRLLDEPGNRDRATTSRLYSGRFLLGDLAKPASRSSGFDRSRALVRLPLTPRSEDIMGSVVLETPQPDTGRCEEMPAPFRYYNMWGRLIRNGHW